MKEKRYYYNGNLEIGNIIIFDGDEFHHLANVLRAKIGDKIALINGNGKFYISKILKLEKKHAQIQVEDVIQSNCEPKINLTLFQALAKGDKLSLITQKISELGASNLILFESDYSDVKGSTNKTERLENVAISASKQCGRASILNIYQNFNIKKICDNIKEYEAFFVAYENEDNHSLVDSLNKISNCSLKNIAVMIGPEGGFSEKEISLLKNSGADIVSLGKRILRTETAAITVSAIIMSIMDK